MDRTGIIVITLCAILFGVWVFEQTSSRSNRRNMPRLIRRHHQSGPGDRCSTANPSSPLDNAAKPSSAQAGTVVFDTNAPEL